MKFICRACKDDGFTKDICILKFKGKHIDYEREEWRMALRRCPFEETTTDKHGIHFHGKSAIVNWERVK